MVLLHVKKNTREVNLNVVFLNFYWTSECKYCIVEQNTFLSKQFKSFHATCITASEITSKLSK